MLSFIHNDPVMRFVERFRQHCESKGTSPHKTAQETGVDTTMVSNWMSGKRQPRPETVMDALQKFAQSKDLGIDFPTLAYWWAQDYLPPEAFAVVLKELAQADPEAAAERKEAYRRAGKIPPEERE